MRIILTTHAIERGQERLNLDPEALMAHAIMALTEGNDALQDPTLRPMLLERAKKHDAHGMYNFKNGVYVFIENRLITVYPIDWISTYKG